LQILLIGLLKTNKFLKMALIIKTGDPDGLLAAIKKAIDDDNIVTWSYGYARDFTHTPDQWKNKAWLVPKISIGELRFGILKSNSEPISTETYAIYHGRFIEMLLAHFDSKFSDTCATAYPTTLDSVK
jgi:hypothetical protein